MTEKKEGLRVLLVDDEESIRKVVRQMIKYLGHIVVAEAADGDEAFMKFDEIRLKRSKEAQIQLVVTDYSMPRVNGVWLANWLRVRSEHLPVVLMSGLTESIESEDHRCVNLRKPFRHDQLEAAIAEAMSKRP